LLIAPRNNSGRTLATGVRRSSHAQRYATRAAKLIRLIDKKTLELLQSYDWPGNIRELQNVIARSVILSSGEILSVDEWWLSKETCQTASRVAAPPSQGEVEPRSERDIIEAALAESRGRQGRQLGLESHHQLLTTELNP
jgi:DNA-binding NtrC family response regulator